MLTLIRRSTLIRDATTALERVPVARALPTTLGQAYTERSVTAAIIARLRVLPSQIQARGLARFGDYQWLLEQVYDLLDQLQALKGNDRDFPSPIRDVRRRASIHGQDPALLVSEETHVEIIHVLETLTTYAWQLSSAVTIFQR